MKWAPHWLKGGDPIRIKWLGEHPAISLDGLAWREVAKWGDPKIPLSISTGHDQTGRMIAWRISGRIARTARATVAEMGWLAEQPDEEWIGAPFVPADVWSVEWLRWSHGEATDSELLKRLEEHPASSWMAFPRPAQKKRSPFLKSLILAAVAATVGLVVGYWAATDRESISSTESKGSSLQPNMETDGEPSIPLSPELSPNTKVNPDE